MRGASATSQGRRARRIAATFALMAGFMLVGPGSALGADTFVNSVGPGPDCLTPATACTSIQDAHNRPELGTGDTIHIAAGTYTEQVEVTKGVTLQGASSTTTRVLSPNPPGSFASAALAPFPGGAGRPVIYAHSGVGDVDINDLQVAGAALGGAFNFYGIVYWNTSGSVLNVDVIDVRSTDKTQETIGILNRNTDGSPRNFEVGNSSVEVGDPSSLNSFTTSGIAAGGGDLAINVHDNDNIGEAGIGISGNPQADVSNGIVLDAGVQGTVDRNLVTGNQCTDLGVGGVCSANLITHAQSTGIRLSSTDSPNQIKLDSNTVEDNDVGIYDHGSHDGSVSVPAVEINNGEILGSRYTGVYVNDGSLSVTRAVISGLLGAGNADAGLSAVSLAGGFIPSVTMTGNHLTGSLRGIQLISDLPLVTPPPSVVAHFNRISGNPNAGVYNETTFNADHAFENNWWGCNEGPNVSACDDAQNVQPGGSIDANPWLVLRLLLSNDEMVGGGSISVTADLTQNSVGADVSAGNNFAVATDAILTSTIGTFADSTPPFVNGKATTTLNTTASATGVAQLRAELDTQKVPPLPEPGLPLDVFASGKCANTVGLPKATSGGDSLIGTIGGDRIAGLGGPDFIKGLDRDDCLKGEGGADRLLGGPGVDNLNGGPGNDRLNPNSGKDKASGGPGNDHISAVDNTRDNIFCGSGKDTVRADAKDKVSGSCEGVSRV